MPRKPKDPRGIRSLDGVADYRYPEATRKNNPPANIAAEGFVPLVPKAEYYYSPRRPPELSFDSAALTDQLPELLYKATQEPLTKEQANVLAQALQIHEPWLEWAGKREKHAFTVDPVALHIHERVSAQAILQVAARQDVNRSLFADPQQQYNEAVQFYRHDVNWSNRLILGDSLNVMSSLALREDLTGKVQMIYMDPPYGIKFRSNFQPEINKREVKDQDVYLTREPEMVKAYRDTWVLGIHSYLSYLRDRLYCARELLTDSGSMFLQINDRNLHHVRELLDEVFGPNNFVALITFRTTSNLVSGTIGTNSDYLLWYAKRIDLLKYHQLYSSRTLADDIGERYTRLELRDGQRRFMTETERSDSTFPPQSRVYRHDNIASQGETATSTVRFEFEGRKYHPGAGRHWRTTVDGLRRLEVSRRLAAPSPDSLAYVRFLDDFAAAELSNVWTDTQTGAFTDTKRYVVQTNTKVIGRCILMATDPGDLVLDRLAGAGRQPLLQNSGDAAGSPPIPVGCQWQLLVKDS